jgi:hypothetical protein
MQHEYIQNYTVCVVENTIDADWLLFFFTNQKYFCRKINGIYNNGIVFRRINENG